MAELTTDIKSLPVTPETPETARTRPEAMRSGFARNLVTSLAYFGVNILVGIWFTPYLIRHLGIAAYGLIPLTATITAYLSLATIGLNIALNRYVMIALEQNEPRLANRFFNTSLVATLAVILLLAGPAYWICCHADMLLRLPVGAEHEVSMLLAFTVGMFLLTTLAAPFEVASFCRNRFDIRSAVQIATTLIRVGGVVILFELAIPRIWQAGAASMLAAAVSLVCAVWIWHKMTPQLAIAPRDFDIPALKELFRTGGWIVINQVGTLLYLNIDLLVVNRMLGTGLGGEYAAVLQWSALLRVLAATCAAIFAPTIFSYYACNEIEALVSYTRWSVKILGLGIALPTGLICGLAAPILNVWLGPQYTKLAPLTSLLTFHLCVNLCVLSLFHLQVVTNRVRWPGLVTCGMGIGNIILAVVLTGPAHFGMYGVALAGAIMLTAKNAVFTPLYGAHILQRPWLTFVREIALICCVTAVVAGAGWLLANTGRLASLPMLVTAGLAISALYTFFVWQFLFSPQERSRLRGMIRAYDPTAEAR
jgi:membrane protein EpsK